MNLQQLRYLVAIVDSGLNITAAASRAHTSQPGVSRQIKQLEDELGFNVFARRGRALAQLTPEGRQVVDRAHRILHEVRSIRRLADEIGNDSAGDLSIGTTHTQARYVLPDVIRRFRRKYPDVKLQLHQGTSEQIAELARAGHIDFAIATGTGDYLADLVCLPCYHWRRVLVVPRAHPLASQSRPTLATLASYPLITYTFSSTGPSSLTELFAAAGLQPNFALTARDADVIKTYVRIGLGIGIVASVAVDPVTDPDLAVVELDHLLSEHTTWIGVRRSALLRRYMYDFIREFGPHLDRRTVDRARETTDEAALTQQFAGVELPNR